MQRKLVAQSDRQLTAGAPARSPAVSSSAYLRARVASPGERVDLSTNWLFALSSGTPLVVMPLVVANFEFGISRTRRAEKRN